MSRTHRPVALALSALAVLVATSVRAQKAAQTAGSSASSSPSIASAPAVPPTAAAGPMLDIVRLKDGSFVRGTIVEHGVHTRTVIETRTGSRTFEAAEIAYAGLATRDPGATSGVEVPVAPSLSASNAPSATAPVPIVSEMDKKVHFRADADRVQYHARALGKGGSGELKPLCVAPCDLALPRGAYRLALGAEGQSPLYTRENVELKDGVTVQGRVLNRSLTRAVGWSIMGLSVVPIVYGVVRGLTAAKPGDRGLGFVVATVGVGTAGAGFVITRAKDVAEAEVMEEKASKAAVGPTTHTGPPLVMSVGGQF